MIKPRPTIHVSASPLGFFTPGRRTTTDTRPEAWCPCGARLSQYRPGGDTRCAPCQHANPPTPNELHPPRRPDQAPCPRCGELMNRQSKVCRDCRDEMLRRPR